MKFLFEFIISSCAYSPLGLAFVIMFNVSLISTVNSLLFISCFTLKVRFLSRLVVQTSEFVVVLS